MTPALPLLMRLGLLPPGDVTELLLELDLVLDRDDNFSGSCCLIADALIFGALVALTKFTGGALLMLAVLHLSFLRSIVVFATPAELFPSPVIPPSRVYSSVPKISSSCCDAITPETGMATLGDNSSP